MTEEDATKRSASPGTPPAPREEPWVPFESLRREVDRLFDDFLPARLSRHLGRSPLAQGAWPRGSVLGAAPAMDVVEKDGGWELTLELPGMEEKDVEVKLAGGVLTIRGEKKEEKEEQAKEYHVSERRYGAFQRSMRLPDAVDADAIEARFSKGVLTVKLPKSPEAKADEKRIEVRPS